MTVLPSITSLSFHREPRGPNARAVSRTHKMRGSLSVAARLIRVGRIVTLAARGCECIGSKSEISRDSPRGGQRSANEFLVAARKDMPVRKGWRCPRALSIPKR